MKNKIVFLGLITAVTTIGIATATAATQNTQARDTSTGTKETTVTKTSADTSTGRGTRESDDEYRIMSRYWYMAAPHGIRD